MRFKPSNNGEWYYLPRLSNPDEAEQNFLHCAGEFSIYRQEAFEKHLKQYKKLNKFYSHLNGKKIKAVIKENNLWYGRQGLEELIYNAH